MTDVERLSTANDFLLGTDGTAVGPPLLPLRITTREQALRTAVWIELMGESLPSEHGNGRRPTLDQIRHAINST